MDGVKAIVIGQREAEETLKGTIGLYGVCTGNEHKRCCSYVLALCYFEFHHSVCRGTVLPTEMISLDSRGYALLLMTTETGH